MRRFEAVTFDPQTGQLTTTTATLPDHIEARCKCGALLLRVNLSAFERSDTSAPAQTLGGPVWASVCVACGKVTASVTSVPPNRAR